MNLLIFLHKIGLLLLAYIIGLLVELRTDNGLTFTPPNTRVCQLIVARLIWHHLAAAAAAAAARN